MESTEQWAAAELCHAALGDKRLNRRLLVMVEALAAQPTESVPQAMGTWAATKAAYRFWDDDAVTPEAIREAHRGQVLERCAGEDRILAIQDTTSLDFSKHPATKGLGPLDRPFCRGMKAHSVLVASTQGIPLGIIHQEVWSRDQKTIGKRHSRRQRATKDKESRRWLTALNATQGPIAEKVGVVTVADREADIYDLMAAPRRAGSDLLIRANHNRRVEHEACYIWEAIRSSPPRGEYTFALHRKEDKPARTVMLTVRCAVLTIAPPRNRQARKSLRPVPMGVILAEEEHPPEGIEPVCWLLLTTLPLESLEEAVRYIRWYTYRWLVERYHYTLKSGCRLEALQLEEADRLKRALATYSIVAWRLLWLTYEARRDQQRSCALVLKTEEWQSLYCTIHKTPIPPTEPPTLQQAIRWIAQLGGFLGRKHDGQPGVKTTWRGFQRLHDIAATWRLLHSSPSPLPGVVGNA